MLVRPGRHVRPDITAYDEVTVGGDRIVPGSRRRDGAAGRARPQMYEAGLTALPSSWISKWRWQPVEDPVVPTVPTVPPAET